MVEQHEITPPVFVLGCMRSGTTLVGAFIGSAPEILPVGELGALYFSNFTASQKYSKAPSPYKQQYLELLQQQSVEFVKKLCRENGAQTFVEDTPWNLRIVPKLKEMFPDAIYLVNVRHYAGVIQSMRKSWEAGYTWAGPTDEDRAKLWAEFNSHIDQLPQERTIFFSYDKFCKHPKDAIDDLELQLRDKGIKGPFDRAVFVENHASKEKKSTVCQKDNAGNLHFKPIEPIDKNNWSEADERAVSAIVRPICEKIQHISGIELTPIVSARAFNKVIQGRKP